MEISKMTHRLVAFELSICERFNRIGHPLSIRYFFVVVSRLGNGIFWYSLIAILPLLYTYYGLIVAIKMLFVGLINLAIYKFIKNHIERLRPYAVTSHIQPGTTPLDKYSFPSGHTLHAVAFTFVQHQYFPELSWLTIPFTILVTLSRMILGLHYPTDVITGAFIGISVAVVSCQFF